MAFSLPSPLSLLKLLNIKSECGAHEKRGTPGGGGGGRRAPREALHTHLTQSHLGQIVTACVQQPKTFRVRKTLVNELVL